jgi:hypothetical protein
MLRYTFPTILTAVLLAGCGSANKAVAPPTTATMLAPAKTTTAATSTSPLPGALQAEANAAAAGDIPDNQVFLVFGNPAAGYSMKYPEGWAQRGAGSHVTFRDKNNIVRIVVGAGAKPTLAAVRAGLGGAQVTGPPQLVTVSGRPTYKVTYTTESTPNAVTGKRAKLVTDRYYLWKGGRRAVIDLGTPQGVDNVDAYRLMVESFRWK